MNSNSKKIVSLFQYIKALSELKYSVNTDINKQTWKYQFSDFPDDPDYVQVFFMDSEEDNDESDEDVVLLSVTKPEYVQCPPPSDQIVQFLVPDWKEHISIKNITNNISFFLDEDADLRGDYYPNEDEKINDAYNKWINICKEWAIEQKITLETRDFFSSLYKAYIELNNETETMELMVGNGIITVASDHSLHHPVLLKRARFSFDPDNNTICICDTDKEPELYMPLLQKISFINHDIIRDLQQELHENYYHPLDRNSAADYLRRLTHQLCSESIIVEDDNEPTEDDQLIMRLEPVVFIRRKIDGTGLAVDRIIETINDTDKVPGYLSDLVSGERIMELVEHPDLSNAEKLAAVSGENREILLAKEANREQLEIAQRIRDYNAVLVQGPPGTGKTHTIANLVGNFLAEGKNVLVTSEKNKALTVLKEQVPSQIQDLCVSVLDDTKRDMERSIDGITEYISRHQATEVQRKLEAASDERNQIIDILSDVREKIFAIKNSESQPVIIDGKSFSPLDMAKFVHENDDVLSYIPGQVDLHKPLPVSLDELRFLYRSNDQISAEEERELNHNLPTLNEIMTPEDMYNIYSSADKYNNIITEAQNHLHVEMECHYDDNTIVGINNDVIWAFESQDAVDDLDECIKQMPNIDNWMIKVAAEGNRGGEYRRRWEKLVESITDTSEFLESILVDLTGKKINIQVNNEMSYEDLISQYKIIQDLYKRKGKITKINRFTNKLLQPSLDAILINDKMPSSEYDCAIVIKYLNLLIKKKDTANQWNDLMGNNGLPMYESFDSDADEITSNYANEISKYLDWYNNSFNAICDKINAAGFNAKKLLENNKSESVTTRIEKSLDAIENKVPLYLTIVHTFIKYRSLRIKKEETVNILKRKEFMSSPLCHELAEALNKGDCNGYNTTWKKLSIVLGKRSILEKRKDILDRIYENAPDWSVAISNREGVYGSNTCPENIEDAWKWKQFDGIINQLTREPFEKLQEKSVELSVKLRAKTEEVATLSAWYHLLLKIEANLQMQQALQGWKQTTKKIGKGTGKNAPMLRRRARELMALCQEAVPAWIMPLNKALETYNPSSNCFDVIIIDEASQSDITALAILYMSKKVIIVGDDKQVSPLAVGVDVESVNNLMQMHIKDSIPNWHLYDAKTSLYDIARTTYQPLMLIEHFRCVPEIIGYSNKLSYDYKIKPLRDASSSNLLPAVIPYRVNGNRFEHSKYNREEVFYIVAFMMACIEQDEYKDKTFGAISLLGNQQAKYIQEKIIETMDPNIIEQHRILCGDASSFQGDERDVIFISLVDSNEGDGPLRKSGEGVDNSTKQRYNVAVSRAKDQLWIIHSLDYTKDLKTGDMRRDLLEYAENPQAFNNKKEEVAKKSESPFEESVGNALVAEGYNIEQQWPVGGYRIDIVVKYKNNKIAVECDGEQFHSTEEQILSDMERQTILERIGWKFIRIRGSKYYRNPEAAMNNVFAKLKEYGIEPETGSNSSHMQSSELFERVKIRAMEIVDTIRSDDTDYYTEKNILISHAAHLEKAQTKGREKKTKTDVSRKIANSKSQARIQEGIKGQISLFDIVDGDSKSTNNEEQDNSTDKDNELIHMLKVKDFEVIDNRANSGILWVICTNDNKDKFESVIEAFSNKYSYERRGAVATNNKPAWRIMCK